MTAQGRGWSDYYGPVTTLIDCTTAPRNSPGVLVALATARQASALTSLGAEQRRACVLAQVDRWLGAGAPPLAYAECDWTGEPWSAGGYGCHLAPMGWTRVGISSAAESARPSPIHWASGDIADHWRGYMEGAVACGERAANAVLRR